MWFLMGIFPKPYIPFLELKGFLRPWEGAGRHSPACCWPHRLVCGFRIRPHYMDALGRHAAWGAAVLRGSKTISRPPHGSFSSFRFGNALFQRWSSVNTSSQALTGDFIPPSPWFFYFPSPCAWKRYSEVKAPSLLWRQHPGSDPDLQGIRDEPPIQFTLQFYPSATNISFFFTWPGVLSFKKMLKHRVWVVLPPRVCTQCVLQWPPAHGISDVESDGIVSHHSNSDDHGRDYARQVTGSQMKHWADIWLNTLWLAWVI